MIFDTHAHYDDARFDHDRDSLLSSMPENGVALILNPACDWETAQKAISYAETFEHVYAAVGYHPENCIGVDIAVLQQMEALLGHPKVKAIGEIGLDYYWEKEEAPRQHQREFFRAQLQMASRLGLPVIVHDREAHLDTLTMLEQYPKVTGVMHCFSGSAEFAQQILNLGYYISFTGVITFKNARKTLDALRAVPLERLLLETDAPYMAPEPCRGKRCDSTLIAHMVRVIAEVKGVSEQQVLDITMENGKRLFGI